MSNIRLIDREVTQPELERMQQGFAEYEQEQGAPTTAQERHTVVAMDGDKFIGCASGLATNNHWFYLTDLWVEKPYRRQGLGTAILGRLESNLASIGINNIYTWTAGYEAPDFYRRQGYEAFCELEDYYAPGYGRLGFRKRVR